MPHRFTSTAAPYQEGSSCQIQTQWNTHHHSNYTVTDANGNQCMELAGTLHKCERPSGNDVDGCKICVSASGLDLTAHILLNQSCEISGLKEFSGVGDLTSKELLGAHSLYGYNEHAKEPKEQHFSSLNDAKDRRHSKDFWDRFEAEEDEEISEPICYSVTDVIVTTLQIIGSAFGILCLMAAIVTILCCVIILSTPSTEPQKQFPAQLNLFGILLLPTLLFLPLEIWHVFRKGAKCPNKNLLALTMTKELMEVASLSLSALWILPKLPFSQAVLYLSACATLPESVIRIQKERSSCERATPSINRPSLMVLLQVSTIVSLCSQAGQGLIIDIVTSLLIVMVKCFLERIGDQELCKKTPSNATCLLIGTIFRVTLLVCVPLVVLDLQPSIALASLYGSVPYYVKMATVLSASAFAILLPMLKVMDKCGLAKATSCGISVTSPVLLLMVAGYSLFAADGYCLQSDGVVCVTQLHFLSDISLSWPLLMAVLAWVWSHCGLLTSCAQSGKSFRMFNMTLADLSCLSMLENNNQNKGNVNRLVLPQCLPVSSKRASAPRDGHDTITPKVYVCATMWHENQLEMAQLLKSIFRLDEYQSLKRQTSELLSQTHPGLVDPDFYTCETHIFFDDAMEWTSNAERSINPYTKQLAELVQTVAEEMYGLSCMMEMPQKIPTPYGGRLIWILPGENQLVIHLKDKQKIRNKKRWSMVAYMYYLLGYKLLSDYPEDEAWTGPGFPADTQVAAENTFVLTIDGDVDFEPESLKHLIDELRSNKKVGVVCGRIHPIGTGLVVWYQRFEYAISHWLHKTAEQVMGVVLCTPGAFSLFRASALMDLNVMRKYAKTANSAWDVLECEQGEDRWLCTLLLQQGHRCEYVSKAVAKTYAPETIEEFFNQRRRWALSNIVNHLDLLMTWRNSYLKNRDISLAYIIFQVIIFLSTLVGPAFVILVLAHANGMLFHWDLQKSYLVSLVPPMFYTLFCCVSSPKSQIQMAKVMCAGYACLMLTYLIATCMQLSEYRMLSSLGLAMMCLGCLFIITAFLHPREILDLLPGILYYISIPTSNLLLMIYAFINMDNVSWGTREVVPQSPESGHSPSNERDDMVCPAWAEHQALQDFPMEYLDEHEILFWQRLIARYLQPIDHEHDREARLRHDLKILRNKSCVMYFMINAICLMICFAMQKRITEYEVHHREATQFEPIAMICIIMFGLILLTQFLCLLWKRCMRLLISMITRVAKCCGVGTTTNQINSTIQMAKSVVEQLRQLNASRTSRRLPQQAGPASLAHFPLHGRRLSSNVVSYLLGYTTSQKRTCLTEV